MADNIILIGFMGVGKGRTARVLADQTGRFTVDTDDLIESMVNIKIRNIFADQGETKFRRLEQNSADWLEYHVSGTVVSTGGGFFKVRNLNRLGKVIYLHSTVEDIYHSICNHPNAKKKTCGFHENSTKFKMEDFTSSTMWGLCKPLYNPQTSK